MRRLLQEPLLHFLLIGIALFVVYDKVAAPSRSGTSIVVSEALVERLARDYEARWTRKPSEGDLATLIESHVHDEILYREGMAVGLDRDDDLIKRRVRQKFELMAEEEGARAAPSEADLQAYMSAHAGRFTVPAKVSFEQIFFANTGQPLDVESAVRFARLALARGADPRGLGQTSVLPRRLESTAQDLVARDFGAEFARQLEAAPLGEWSGPIVSGLGAHLVRVTAREPPALPELDRIRHAVARDWENERRASARDESYRKLRGRYTVAIEPKGLTARAAQR